MTGMADSQRGHSVEDSDSKYQAFDVGGPKGEPQHEAKKRSTLLTVCPFILGQLCASYAPVHNEKVSQTDALQHLMSMHAALALNVAFQRAPPSIEVSNIVIVLTLGFTILHQTKEAVILTKSAVRSSHSRRRYSWASCSSHLPSMTCRQ